MLAVRNLVDATVAAGVGRAELLRAARLAPAQLQARDARLARSKFFEYVQIALDLSGDAALGLHSIERLASEALNPIAGLVAHAATVGDALRSIDEFRHQCGDDATFGISETEPEGVLRCARFTAEPPGVQRFMAELTLGGLFRVVRGARGQEYVRSVSFAYGPPPSVREYTRFFGELARFDQPDTGMRFDSRLLTLPLPHADPGMHRTLRAFATRRDAHLGDRRSLAARVREALVWQPAPRDTTMAGVARRLGLSERSLRRGLKAEGKAYGTLVNEALADVAKACLLDEERTIIETAHELGFADNTTFHRAFKRWTGLTPLQYRRQQATG